MEQQHGSLSNMALAQGKPPIKPEVGMGATYIMWTDRHAYTIIDVHESGKRFTMQRDNAVRSDKHGMSDSQSYTYEPDPTGQLVYVSLRKDGRWKEVKQGTVVGLGYRDEYYDFGF